MGKRGPKVSTVGFGAWAIGGKNWGETDDKVSKNALHTALDQGVTLIDTADVFGFGHSENLIAEVIRERGKKETVIATKAGNDFYFAKKEDDQGYGAIQQNYKKDYIIYAADRHRRLNAVGLELDAHVAEIARRNVQTRGLLDRVTIMVADVRDYRTAELFDMLTLYNNIYYFCSFFITNSLEKRISLLIYA